MRSEDSFEFASDRIWDETPEVAEDAVRDVLVAGDTHGSKAHLNDAVTRTGDLSAERSCRSGTSG